MTNERQHPDSAAETDETVSATYRELSREGAPNYLNEKVLQQAARTALRPRYSRSIMWTRPLAWAATVGLCLAIVLEVTSVPAPEIVVRPGLMSPEPVSPELQDSLEAELPLAPSPKLVSEPVQAPVQMKSEALLDKKSQLGRAAAKQASNEPRSEVRMRDAASEADADLITVEEKAGIAALALPASIATNECAEEVRANPVTWLECIADLEKTGDTEAALRQREALKEAFPQFEMP